MDKTKALQLWEKRYGDREIAYDYAAQKMVKDDFENEASGYSWTVDLIKPASGGGRYTDDNLMIASSLTTKVRAGKPSFRFGNILFEVRKGKSYGTSALYDVTDRNHPLEVSSVRVENLEESAHLQRQKEIYGREKKNDFVLPNLSAIRKNVVKENAPEIQLEYEEKSPAVPAVMPMEEEIPETKNTLVEEATLESVMEPVEEAKIEETRVSLVEATAAKEEPVMVPLPEEEEEIVVDERNILIDALAQETADADLLRGLYQKSLVEKEILLQTKRNLSQNVLALKEASSLHYENCKKEQEKVQSLEKQVSECSASNKDALDAINLENAELKTELGTQLNEYARLEEIYQSVQEELARIKAEKDTLQSEKEALQLSLDQGKEANENSLQLLQAENARLQADTSSLKMELEALENKKAKLISEKEKMESVLQEKEEIHLRLSEEKESEWKAKEESFNQTIAEKEAEIQSLHERNESLSKEKDTLQSDVALADERVRNTECGNEELQKKIDDLTVALEEEKQTKENEKAQSEETIRKLREEKDDLNDSFLVTKAEKESAIAEKDSFYNKNVELNVELSGLKNENTELRSENEKLSRNMEANEESHKESISVLLKQKEEMEGKITFMTLGGDIEHYGEYLFYLSDNDKKNTKENIIEALNLNPSWHRKEEQRVNAIREGVDNIEGKIVCLDTCDVSYLEKEKADREKALSYWAMKFGDIEETTDFAGRVINISDYLDKHTGHGWNFFRIDSDEREYEGNIAVANLRTILDYRENESFTSNGESFHVVKENGINRIESESYVTDPYDLGRTLAITKENLNKVSPLIYLFVKCVGKNNGEADPAKLMEFYDVIDRTVKRTCPRSFIEMRAKTGKINYAFLTFDGNVEGAYKEALDYALLLNSYRNELRKEENGINGFIVLDQVMIPYSYRHLGFEQLLTQTKDVEMRAIHYEFIQTVIVNSLIKKSIHIGPSILDSLPLDQASLKGSDIGQSRSFSQIYNFTGHFNTYNFVFSLKKGNTEENNN